MEKTSDSIMKSVYFGDALSHRRRHRCHQLSRPRWSIHRSHNRQPRHPGCTHCQWRLCAVGPDIVGAHLHYRPELSVPVSAGSGGDRGRLLTSAIAAAVSPPFGLSRPLPWRRPAQKPLDANTAIAIAAGMLGVSAMAVQNGMVHISLKGAPATAVMTTNISILTIDVVSMLIAQDPNDVAKARSRARHTWPAVVGFAVGCTLGASCEMLVGLRSLVLSAGLAFLALALGR